MNYEEFAKKAIGTLYNIPVYSAVVLPKFEDLVAEYDKLTKRHWKRKKELEQQMFWVAYQKYKLEQ